MPGLRRCVITTAGRISTRAESAKSVPPASVDVPVPLVEASGKSAESMLGAGPSGVPLHPKATTDAAAKARARAQVERSIDLLTSGRDCACSRISDDAFPISRFHERSRAVSLRFE
jgi:hypothetical protein